MPIFKTQVFDGELPRVSRRLLPEVNSFQAWNCELIDGDLTPTRYSVAEGSEWDDTDPPETLTAYYDDTGVFRGWLSLPYWTNGFIIRPLPNDEYDRIYYLSASGELLVTDHASLSFNNPNGNRITITSSQPAGIPKPTPRPTDSVVAMGDDATTVDVSHVITYIDKYNAEGAASNASNIVQVTGNGTVRVTRNDTAPSHVTGWRIYRGVSGTAETSYQFVGEASIGTNTFDDDMENTPQEVLPTDDWFPPENGLQGLIHCGQGILAAFIENTVYFSEKYLPNAWPPSYKISVGHDIVNIGAIASSVIALTISSPWIISGALPNALAATKMETEEACVSKKSVVTQGSQIVYGSPNGLVAVGLGEINLLTEPSLTRQQWETMDPPTVRNFAYRDSVLLSYGDITDPTVYDLSEEPFPKAGIMVLDPGQQGYLTFHEVGSDYGVTRPHDETFFWALWDPLDSKWKLYQFNPTEESGGVRGEYTWRSKVFVAPFPIAVSCAQIDAESYPITMRVLADGTVHWVGSVTSDRVFKIPPGKFKYWEFELIGSSTVYSAGIATSVRDLKQQI
ncbi:MAG: hypothetical protein VW443_05240 [Pseudomonadales bacterium]